jgi:mRNA interferase RelE/StbE
VKPVVYSVTAARALRRHANKAASLRAKIQQYAENPSALAANVTALQGVDAKRLRVGDFRIAFRETDDVVLVLDIGPRGSIYD